MLTVFAPKARRAGESDIAFADRITARLGRSDRPHFDIEPDAVPPRTLQDGTCGRCRWRALNGAIVIDPLAPCVCGKDEYRLIKAKIESPVTSIAMQGLLELERFKIKNMERK